MLSVVIVIFYSCNNNDNKQAVVNDSSTKETPVKNLPIHLFDSLEHFFGNENWQMIDGGDTSYMYFSRQSDWNIKVYLFDIKKGDSVNSITTEISFKGDSLVWKRPNEELLLKQALDKEIDWVNTNMGGEIISFKKAGKNKMLFQKGSRTIFMNQTITLSDFLIRRQYDFLHGTKFAFSDTSFNVKRKI